jgi:ribosomal protein S18 acetylase RimI-like enzyme
MEYSRVGLTSTLILSLRHYITGWPRPDDFGVVAVDAEGRSAGAAWARTLPAEDSGYGFVAADVPEVSMAVVPEWRGRGLGRAMLRALLEMARHRKVPALSLSVEDGNRAIGLYRSAGFRTVGRNGGSDTMLLDLQS